MKQTSVRQLLFAKEKLQKAFYLLNASVEKTGAYDVDKIYTPDDLSLMML